jgi:hypothetical protein
MKTKNYTFALPVETMEKFKEYASLEHIPSVNAAVKEALAEYIVKMDREQFRCEMLAAAKDPLFMQDLQEISQDFETADAETARRIDSW